MHYPAIFLYRICCKRQYNYKKEKFLYIKEIIGLVKNIQSAAYVENIVKIKGVACYDYFVLRG